MSNFLKGLSESKSKLYSAADTEHRENLRVSKRKVAHSVCFDVILGIMGTYWYSDDEIIKAIKNHPRSVLEASKKSGINYWTLIRRAKILGIYKPNQSGKGYPRKATKKYLKYVTEDILAGKHPTYTGTKLKKRLLKEGHKKNQCEECGQSPQWNGKVLKMHLDHVNGDSTDHRLNNLRILCPNCHSQTPTYCGRNKRKKL